MAAARPRGICVLHIAQYTAWGVRSPGRATRKADGHHVDEPGLVRNLPATSRDWTLRVGPYTCEQ